MEIVNRIRDNLYTNRNAAPFRDDDTVRYRQNPILSDIYPHAMDIRGDKSTKRQPKTEKYLRDIQSVRKNIQGENLDPSFFQADYKDALNALNSDLEETERLRFKEFIEDTFLNDDDVTWNNRIGSYQWDRYLELYPENVEKLFQRAVFIIESHATLAKLSIKNRIENREEMALLYVMQTEPELKNLINNDILMAQLLDLYDFSKEAIDEATRTVNAFPEDYAASQPITVELIDRYLRNTNFDLLYIVRPDNRERMQFFEDQPEKEKEVIRLLSIANNMPFLNNFKNLKFHSEGSPERVVLRTEESDNLALQIYAGNSFLKKKEMNKNDLSLIFIS